ncbi:MAG: class I SAM-dependent methyltransferase [candidate division WOR-3 bacterium]
MNNDYLKEKIYQKIKEITEKNEDWMKLSMPNWEKGEKEKYLKSKSDLKIDYTFFVNFLDSEFSLKNKKILDLGCGFGHISFLLEEKKAKVFSLDIEKDFVYVVNLKKKLAESNIKPLIGNGFALPFKNKSFDIVICTHTLEHIRDSFNFLKEVNRVLKIGGILYLSIPNYFFPFEPHFKVPLIPFLPKNLSKFLIKNFFYRKGLKRINKKWEDIPFLESFLLELNFIKFFELEKLIKKAGFKIYKKNFIFDEEMRPSKKLLLKKILKIFRFYPFETRFIAIKNEKVF